jgi:hypothetical protein
MKNNNVVLILLLFICSQSSRAYVDPKSAWPSNAFPVHFVMDNTKTPNGVVNSNNSRNEMIRVIDEWNQNSSFGTMVEIVQGTVDNSPNS